MFFLFPYRLYYSHLAKKSVCYYQNVKVVREFQNNLKFLMLLQINFLVTEFIIQLYAVGT